MFWRWTVRAPMLHPTRGPLSMETLGRHRIWGYQVTFGQVLEVVDAATGIAEPVP